MVIDPKWANPRSVRKHSLTIMDQFHLARHILVGIEKMHHRLAEIPARAMLAKASEAGEPVRRSPVLQNLLAMAAASDAFAHRELGPSRAARSIIQARAARRRFFDSELFADPAWDMLLELYALEGEGLRISVSKLSLAAGVPCTTALRWLDKLESESLLVREEDPTDGRRVWVKLSPIGIAAMDSYFRQIAAQRSA